MELSRTAGGARRLVGSAPAAALASSGWNRFQNMGGEITRSSSGSQGHPPLTFDAGAGKRLSRWKRFRNHLPGSPTSQRGRASGSPPSRGSSTTAETSRQRRGSGCSRRFARSSIGPSSVAQNLSLKRTLVIGVVLPFLTEASPIERVRGIVTALASSPYDLALYDVESADRQQRAFRLLADAHRTDGLLVVSLIPPDEEVRRLRAESIPCVLIDARHDGLPSVVIDDVAGGELATPAPARARASPHRVHRRQAGRPLPLPVEPRPDDRVRARSRIGRGPDPARVRPRGNAEPPRRAEHRGRAAAAPRAADGGVRRLGRPGARRARSGPRPRRRRARSSCR